jgi:hypothetical protein
MTPCDTLPIPALQSKENTMSYDSRPDTLEHIKHVQRYMERAMAQLLYRAVHHDLSKLESPEREVFDEMTPKLAASTYGSDEYKGFLAAMKPALDHHYANNSHHPEHYKWRCGICLGQFSEEVSLLHADGVGNRFCPRCIGDGPVTMWEGALDENPQGGIRGMSLLDLLEMLCDWKAATLRHNDGDLRKSIEINQKRFGYSDELKRLLINTAHELELL